MNCPSRYVPTKSHAWSSGHKSGERAGRFFQVLRESAHF
jgi:hypothetical protein